MQSLFLGLPPLLALLLLAGMLGPRLLDRFRAAPPLPENTESEFDMSGYPVGWLHTAQYRKPHPWSWRNPLYLLRVLIAPPADHGDKEINNPRVNREYALQLISGAAERLALAVLNHSPDVQEKEIQELTRLLRRTGVWAEGEEFSWCDGHGLYESPIGDKIAHMLVDQARFIKSRLRQS